MPNFFRSLVSSVEPPVAALLRSAAASVVALLVAVPAGAQTGRIDLTPTVWAGAGYGLYQVAVPPDREALNIPEVASASGAIQPSCPGGSSNHAGWSAGLGLDLPSGALGARIEARYTKISVPGGFYSYVPFTFALRF